MIAAALIAALLAASAGPPAAGQAATAPGPELQARRPAIPYEDAERLARAGQTARAIEAFQALADANPADFDSRVWLGRLLTRVGRRAEAIALLGDVIAQSPRQVDARVALGAALLTSGRVEDAFAAVQDAEALAPHSADVLALKGRILRHLGRPSDAYVALDAAHTLSPDDPDVAIVRERTRRIVAHRAHVGVAREASRDGIPVASIVDADVDVHLDDTIRVFGRLQWQERAGADDTRAGGGVEWRLGRRVLSRGAALISPDRRASRGPTSPASWSSSPADPAGHWRALSRFRRRSGVGHRAVDHVDLNDYVTIAARYYRSESTFVPSGQRAGNDSGAIMARWQAAPRLSLSTAYARGNESFDILSVDGSAASAPIRSPAACASISARSPRSDSASSTSGAAAIAS